MMIRLKVGLHNIQRSLPVLTNDRQCAGGLLNEDSYVANSEHKDLKPLQLHYTSLRDLITVPPTKRWLGKQGQEIEWCNVAEPKLKNNLLKLAARAYLQPGCKESRPEVHFVVQCWMAFVARNKTVIASMVGCVQKHVDVCRKFFRAQTFKLMEVLSSHQQVVKLQMPSV